LNSKRIIILNVLFTAILSFVSVNNIFFSNEKTTQEINIYEKNETELNSNNFFKSPLYHQNKLKDINNFFSNLNRKTENINSNYLFFLITKLNNEKNTVYDITYTKKENYNFSSKETLIFICRYNI
jgi:uncharacterized protein YcbK (DUF882 family)